MLMVVLCLPDYMIYKILHKGEFDTSVDVSHFPNGEYIIILENYQGSKNIKENY